MVQSRYRKSSKNIWAFPKLKPRKRPAKNALGRRRRLLFTWKVAILAAFLIALLFIAGWVLRIDHVQIKNVSIEGLVVLKDEQVRSLIEEELSGTYFLVAPRQNSYVFPKTSIEERLSTEFKRIENVRARRVDPQSIVVSITERGPFGLWCGEGYVDTGEDYGNCYFLDDKSFIYAKAPDFTGYIFFQYFGPRDVVNASSTPIGTYYMSDVDFTGFNLFIEAFKELPLDPVSLTKLDDTDYQLRLDTGTVIIFGVTHSLSTVLDTLESILESESLANDERLLEYIDLRFDNRAYYKFVDEEEVETDVEERE